MNLSNLTSVAQALAKMYKKEFTDPFIQLKKPTAQVILVFFSHDS